MVDDWGFEPLSLDFLVIPNGIEPLFIRCQRIVLADVLWDVELHGGTKTRTTDCLTLSFNAFAPKTSLGPVRAFWI